MTNYAILRTKKLNSFGNIAGSMGHTYRVSGMAPNADPLRLGRNKVLVGKIGQGVEEIRHRIDSLDGKIRSNAVLCVEHLLTASPEFFKDKTSKQIEIWSKKNIAWLQKNMAKKMFAMLCCILTKQHRILLLT